MSFNQASEGRDSEPIVENEAQRLQREADEYTKMLEHERK